MLASASSGHTNSPTAVTDAFLETKPNQATKVDLGVETLDRTLTLPQLYLRVSNLIGEAQAQSWLISEKQALEGSLPLDYLRSRVGAARPEIYLGALEDGAHP